MIVSSMKRLTSDSILWYQESLILTFHESSSTFMLITVLQLQANFKRELLWARQRLQPAKQCFNGGSNWRFFSISPSPTSAIHFNEIPMLSSNKLKGLWNVFEWECRRTQWQHFKASHSSCCAGRLTMLADSTLGNQWERSHQNMKMIAFCHSLMAQLPFLCAYINYVMLCANEIFMLQHYILLKLFIVW